MHVQKNDQLGNDLLDEMMAEIEEDRSGMHPSVTDLIYCLTKGFFSQYQPIVHNPQTKMFFITGLGLERALLAKRKEQALYGEFEGIHYHVDSKDDTLIELKSTRMSQKVLEERGFPDNWLVQTKSYCKAVGVNKVDLAVIFLIPAKLEVYHITYEDWELDENWALMKARRDRWNQAVAEGVPPEPFKWNQEYECKDCQYSMTCRVLSNKVPV